MFRQAAQTQQKSSQNISKDISNTGKCIVLKRSFLDKIQFTFHGEIESLETLFLKDPYRIREINTYTYCHFLESIEWNIEDQAFSLSSDLALSPPSTPPLSVSSTGNHFFGSEIIYSGSSILGWIPIRIQGFDNQNWKTFTARKKLYIFLIKNCNLLIPRPL